MATLPSTNSKMAPPHERQASAASSSLPDDDQKSQIVPASGKPSLDRIVVPSPARMVLVRTASLTLGLAMREQDADLLDSIHFSTANDSSGETPNVKSQSGRAAIEEIPSLSLDGDLLQPETTELRRKSTKSLDPDPDSSAAADQESKRQVLAGEVWHSSDGSKPTAEGSSEDVPTTDESVQPSRSKDDGPADRGMARSESTCRRLNEAAQFAEAVGDLKPGEEDALLIIDEEDRDCDFDTDDDDDDATTIHVQDAELDNSSADGRRKSRPQWPFTASGVKRGFFDLLPNDGTTADFVYKGINANPPEIVKRGTARGNYAQLHRKAWLEVSDKYHRYGKNLRLYYRYWERQGCPTNMFFDWLDSKGEAAGQPLPELEECPRAQLDSDTVLYITNPEVTAGYALSFVVDEDSGRGRVFDVDGDPVKTGPDGWIFVLRDNVMYGAQKVTSVSGQSKQRFHHSSFFGGKAVAAAGILITDDEGILTKLYPHSGHYRPGESDMQRVLFFLHHEGVDLRTFEMDTQQIWHVTRDKEAPKKDGSKEDAKGDKKEGKVEKKKKVESLHLMPAVLAACYLAHKARFIGDGIFSQVHRIRKSDATSVKEALEVIDDGGVWLRERFD